uniref:G_PROTEIN_RECEP_F1_2 domain-containing protein n=1 Tax=Macrostomum lignano TaxID=282301 RepID=A0A1I8IY03_9PLAT
QDYSWPLHAHQIVDAAPPAPEAHWPSRGGTGTPMTLLDAALQEACRGGRFCEATAAEFAAPGWQRNLTSSHLYVLMAHCLWCKDVDRKYTIPHLGHCLSHYSSLINSTGPVPPMPPFAAVPAELSLHDDASTTPKPSKSPRASSALGFILALYALLIVVGLLSNLFVAVILLKKRAVSNITNLFVLGLSLSDILMCGMLMPALLVYDLSTRNYISIELPRQFYCRFVLMSLNVPIYASCLIILWIALDRHPQNLPEQARWLLVGTVLLGLAIHSPVIFFNTVDKQRDRACAEKWPNPGVRLAYSIGAFSLQFCTPLLATCVLYLLIYRRLRERAHRRRDSERKRRTNRILVAIVCSFAFFWSPWSIFNVISEVEQFRAKRDPVGAASYIGCLGSGRSYDEINSRVGEIFADDSQARGPFLNCGSCSQQPHLLLIAPADCRAANEGLSIVQPEWNLYEMLVRLFALGSACLNPYLYGWLNEQVRASLRSCLCNEGVGGGVGGPLTSAAAAEVTTAGAASILRSGAGSGRRGSSLRPQTRRGSGRRPSNMPPAVSVRDRQRGADCEMVALKPQKPQQQLEEPVEQLQLLHQQPEEPAADVTREDSVSCSQPVIRQLAEPERTQSEVMGLSRGDRCSRSSHSACQKGLEYRGIDCTCHRCPQAGERPSHPVQRVRLRCISLLSLCEPPEVTTA